MATSLGAPGWRRGNVVPRAVDRRLRTLPLESRGEVTQLRIRHHLLNVRPDRRICRQQGGQANIFNQWVENPQFLPGILYVEADLLPVYLVDALIDDLRMLHVVPPAEGLEEVQARLQRC